MKKYIYTLVIIVLAYGNGFADSIDFLNITGLDSMDRIYSPDLYTGASHQRNLIQNDISLENDFCINPSLRCLDYSFPMNNKSDKHKNCVTLFLTHEGMKTYSITTIYYTSIDAYKTTNEVRSPELDASFLSPINIKFKRLQNLNEVDYFSEPMNPAYFKGFGLQIRI